MKFHAGLGRVYGSVIGVGVLAATVLLGGCAPQSVKSVGSNDSNDTSSQNDGGSPPLNMSENLVYQAPKLGDRNGFKALQEQNEAAAFKNKLSALLEQHPTAGGSSDEPFYYHNKTPEQIADEFSEPISAAADSGSGLLKQPIFTNLTRPIATIFAPDGRVFIAENTGALKVYDSRFDSSPTIARQFAGTIHGLLGVAVHPDFPQTPYVYVLNNVAIGQHAVELVRLSINEANQVTDEIVMLNNFCVTTDDAHAHGDLVFGDDGALYITFADGTKPAYDTGLDNNMCNDPVGQGGGFRTLDALTDGDPLGYNGALLRIDPLTGEASPGNIGVAQDSRVVAIGLRNPFRFALRPSNNAQQAGHDVYIANVGWQAWETILKTNPTSGEVDNFGWPCYEGTYDAPQYIDHSFCKNIMNRNDLADPYFQYHRSDMGQQIAATGISFYKGTSYPAEYHGGLFFADFSSNVLAFIPQVPANSNRINDGHLRNDNKQFDLSSGGTHPDVQVIDSYAPSIVHITSGPNDDLYYTDYNAGKVYRLFSADGLTVVPLLSAEPTRGAPGMTVKFNAEGSAGEGLSYLWDLDGDGAFDDSFSISPTYTYSNEGLYIVSLKVTDVHGDYAIANQFVAVTNKTPVPTIHTPLPGYNWSANDVVSTTGSAVVPESGAAVASDDLEWIIEVAHCARTNANICHVHPLSRYPGANGSFMAIDHEMPTQVLVDLFAKGESYAYQWWNNAWSKRLWLYFDNLNVEQTLTDFPVMVKLDPNRIDYGATGDNGQSIRFVAEVNGVLNELSYEIEKWDVSGESIIWVKVPEISANTTNSFIWLYYGNDAAGPGENKTDVWSNGYAAVYHMQDGTDSTANGNNTNVLTASASSNAPLGQAKYFNGGSYYGEVPNSSSLDVVNTLSIELFTKSASNNNDARHRRIVSKKDSWNAPGGFSLDYNAQNNAFHFFGGYEDNQNRAVGQQEINDGQWHYVAATATGSAGMVYVDGVNVTTDNTMDAVTSNASNLTIGNTFSNVNTNEFYHGDVDELRVSNVARSAAWVKAQSRVLEDRFIFYSREESPSPLVGKQRMVLDPLIHSVTVQSNIGGTQIGLNTDIRTTNYITHEVINNGRVDLFSVIQQMKDNKRWDFNCWSDGDCANNRAQMITAPKTFTANYDEGTNGCNTKYFRMQVAGSMTAWGHKGMKATDDCWWEYKIRVSFDEANPRFKIDREFELAKRKHWGWNANEHGGQPNGYTGVAANSEINPVGDLTFPRKGCTYFVRFNDHTEEFALQTVPGTCADSPNVFIRGTNNGWALQAMKLIGDNVWEALVEFPANETNNRFKFDSAGDWSSQYCYAGAGKVKQDNCGNADIPVNGSGKRLVTVNTANMTYSIRQLDACANGQSCEYGVMHIRGTFNAWASQAMTLIGDNMWETYINVSGTGDANGPDRFKFDTFGDWSRPWGDFDGDRIADRQGSDIKPNQGSGMYRITFNELSGAYTMQKQNTCPGGYACTHTSLYFRGSMLGWGAGNSRLMTLVGDHHWQTNVVFTGGDTQRYKFDVNNDWATVYGDNDGNGVAEAGGDDIFDCRTGEFRVDFWDDSLNYTLTQLSGGTECTPVSNLQRTIIYMYGVTAAGQDMFFRGGIDYNYSKNVLGKDCDVNPVDCMVPIQHNLLQNNTQRSNDKYLDWHGAEAGQGNVQGSPLVWTTNTWPADWGAKKTVANDGYGEDPENRWGQHYWKLDVMMDCSKTVNGWFEVKSYISNGPAWEANVNQAGAPYPTGNHFGECGKMNVFRRGENNPVTIEPLP